MKTKINHLFLFAFFALLSFTACQDEVTEIINPNEQETIIPDSVLANLLSNTTANFGAADDILDGASCFSVEFPVTIIVSDITIVIDSADDLEELEDLFENLDDDEDLLDFVFPITIIFSDYTQLVIENEDQLEDYINQCDDEEDDVIECVDFVYPISFSVFNSEFNLIDTVVIQNDEALYDFLEDLEDDENALIVSLNYPVTLEYTNGETIEVTTNQELADAIEAAGDDCEDEDDDCLEDEVALNLVECPWEVFLYSNDDLENLSGPYIFDFNADGTMVLEGVLEDPYTTTWELTETDNGLELNIASFYYFEQEYGTWLVVECDDDDLEFEHLTVDGTGLFFEQECEDDLDCSITDISGILQECPWDIDDESDDFDNLQFIFNEGGALQIIVGDTTQYVEGNWNLSQTDNGLVLTLSELTAYQDDLGGEWLIVECDDDELEIVKGDLSLELDQNCEGDLECSVEDISENIIECPWEFSTNLIDSLVPIYVYFTPNGQILDSNNNGSGNEMGTWDIVLIGSDIFFDFTFQQGFEVLNGQWQVVECEDGELYLASGNNYIVLDQDCDLENDNDVFNCFDDFEIVECAGPNNVPVFNLSATTIGLIDCPEPFIASFYATLSDAENNINAIENTEAYGTLAAQVYLRIEADSGNFEIFTIYLNTEECIDFDCFEDTELSTCSENNDGIATFNLTEVNEECGPNIAIYGIYYFESESDAQNNLNPIANPENYTNTVNPTTIFAAILNVNGNVVEHVFTITLYVENCNLFDCFESFDAQLEVCDNGTDGPYQFNLDIVFDNCEANAITYHTSEADAEAGLNPITNPSAYFTADFSSIVYANVLIDNQFEVFPIQLNVIDCNPNSCTEGDIDGILTECIWNITSYNGSDDLISYNFNFEQSNGVVVIYNDSSSIEATWSTSQTNDGVIVEFSNVAGPNIQAITGEWLVVECTAAQLVLHNVNNSSNEIILDRTCE